MDYETKRLQELHEAAMKVVENVGMQFMNTRAIEILKDHGIRVEGDIAYFTEEQLMYWVRKAPHTFTLYATNPAHNCTMGGESVNPAPSYGCPYIADAKGKKRVASIEDYLNFVKLFQANEDFDINGGPMVMPGDVEPSLACLAMFYAAITHSDKAMMVHAGERRYMEAMIDASAALWGGYEELKAKPRLITIVDVNSPMKMGEMMADTLIEFSKAGQAFTVSNCSMAGSTSPVTLAGTVVMIIAEVLPVIALAQMVNAGTPVLFGSQSCTADMASGQIAGGSPEGAICYKYTAKLADFYGLPSRGGGAITDSKIVDAQSGYESMLTLLADYEAHMNFIIHTAGILDGYNSTSYEKVLQDFEILRYIKRYMHDFEINEDTIPIEDILEVGHTGQYMTKEHTFEWCRREPLEPMVSTRGVVNDPVNQFQNRLDAYYKKLMDAYTQPMVDKDTLAKVKDALEKGGLDRSWMDVVETK